MTIEVEDVRQRHRYEVTVDGVLAGFVDYRDAGSDRTFRHTEVLDAFEGLGVGSALVRAALDDVRAKGLRVRPRCPFVAGWIARHLDYLDLVAEDYRGLVASGT